MDDNLNTAEALGAIFAMVRDGNTAMDRGEFRAGDRAAFLDTLDRWDRIFCCPRRQRPRQAACNSACSRSPAIASLRQAATAPAGVGQPAIAGNGTPKRRDAGAR